MHSFCVWRSSSNLEAYSDAVLVLTGGFFGAYSLSHWLSSVCALWYLSSGVIACDSL